MPYRPFRNEADLLGEHRNFIQAYTSYIQSENVPTSLADDIQSLQQQLTADTNDSDVNHTEHDTELDGIQHGSTRQVEEWMNIIYK